MAEIISEYKREIDRHGGLEICEVPDERIPGKAGDRINAMILETEGRRLSAAIDRSDYVIALYIDGKKTSEDMLRKHIERASMRGCGTVTFVIGGSLGLAPAIINRADYRMSVSDMTFPHQLMRAALAEMLSRL